MIISSKCITCDC